MGRTPANHQDPVRLSCHLDAGRRELQNKNQTEWYAYPTTNQATVTDLDAGTTYKVRVRARYDDNKKSRWSDVVSGEAGVSPNSPATGQPTIAGTVEVRETLTAATSAISDANGLTNAVFSHQWIRSANGSDTAITDATASTYVVTNADVDKAIKVRVSFTDDDGYSEALTSNATTSVPVPAPVIVPPEEPQIAQAAGDTQVPDDWALKPSGLGVDDSFRLIFLSSTKRNASSSSIGTYNTWIQARAAAGHDDIQGHSDGFTAVGCTGAVDARDNTATTFTSSDKGLPIYWLNGTKVADDYEDFYNGNWDDEVNDKNQLGTNGPDTSDSNNYPFTGCSHNGTKAVGAGTARSLGNSNGAARVGRPNSSNGGEGPLSSALNHTTGSTRPMYGLSAVFTVVDQFTLVSNTGQTRASQSSSIQSQPFTTGSNPGGYTLTSVDVGIEGDNVRTPLFRIVPTQSNGEPDLSDPTKFITLTTPGSTTADKIHTFTAPAYTKLTANTTYHLHLTNPDGGNPGNIHRTSSNAEDDGGAPGWSIGNTRYWRNTSSDPWNTSSTVIRMQINGLPAGVLTRVSNDWSLTPSELGARDQFRLLFLSSTTRNATSSDITDYNTFIQTRAAAGHTDIQAYSNGFTVVGCTEDDDARDNTGTTFTSSDRGVPIYWLGGTKVADEYEDFYDRSWGNASNTHDRDELGINSTNTNQSGNRPWTGCGDNGTEYFIGSQSYALGQTQSGTGDPATNNPIHAGIIAPTANLRSMYGLSQLFEVPPDATLDDLVIEGATNSESISLSPTFDDDTFTYTAAVATGIDSVRLTATTNDSNSTVAITGDSDTSTPNTADFDLDLGTNTLSLTVTAEDGTTQTYTITVARLGTPPPPATVTTNWDLTPDGVSGGQQFRLIFYSSTKRNAQSDDIEDYNTFVQARAAAGHAKIRQYSDGFTAVGCTEDADARDNTQTRYTDSNTGVPIYWLAGLKVADNYRDFYDGSWDEEANDQDRNEVGNTGPDSSQAINYPWTGCDHDGTEAFLASGESVALGNTNGNNVRMGKPGSTVGTDGPLNGNQEEDPADSLPMYGLSQVFTVLPGNTGTLTTGGTPRSDTLDSSDTGHYWQVRLHKNVRYQIDVKGSERSQPGGTITNPWMKLIAGSDRIELLNGNSAGVSQTGTGTEATGGGAGQNSRLDIKVIQATDGGQYYHLLVHRADGDDGSYTVTVTRLDWPNGRRAPDITVDQENQTSVEISWTKSKKTHNSLVAPRGDYKIEYRRLSDTNWTSSGIVDKSDRAETISSLAQNTTYEVRVRMIPPNNSDLTYRWGYARVYTTN